MKVNVIEGGRDSFNTMLYNVPNQNTLNWLNNNMNQARTVLTGIADHILDASINLYNKVNSNPMINAAKELVASVGGHANPYMIYSLNDTTMNSANFIMQQYIMANPVIQKMHNENMCNGFEETYYDAEPGIVGKDRLDYQRVMDGVAYENKSGFIQIDHYSSVDGTELTVSDKNAILDTWAQVENMVLNELDPTDLNN